MAAQAGQGRSREPGTGTSARAVRFDGDKQWVDFGDGRVLGAPLAGCPRLLAASPERRAAHGLSPRGIHLHALDEAVSIDGLLAGRGDLNQARLLASA